jgi:hypothetical protein
MPSFALIGFGVHEIETDFLIAIRVIASDVFTKFGMIRQSRNSSPASSLQATNANTLSFSGTPCGLHSADPACTAYNYVHISAYRFNFSDHNRIFHSCECEVADDREALEAAKQIAKS